MGSGTIWSCSLGAVLCLALGVTAVIRPKSSLSLISGEGFVAYLEVPEGFGVPVNCWFRYRGQEKVKIDPQSTEPILTDRGESILPFAPSVCGIRVNQLTAASAAQWTLEAENSSGDFDEDRITIEVLPTQKTKFDTHVQLELGRRTISCTKHETYTRHCKIFDSATGESWDKCEVETTVRPNKTLECHTFNWGRMQESEEHIYVDIKSATQYATASVEETPTNIVLSCQFINSLSSCRAEMPDRRREIYIMDGLYNGRYSSYDTLTSQNRCSLEIPKPLAAEELGLWKIITYDASTPTGCMYYLGAAKKAIIEEGLERLLAETRVVNVYRPEEGASATMAEINCTAPFAIDDCYLRDPNRTVYFPESTSFDRSRLIGKCLFTNKPIIGGTWKCGVRGHDYEKEVLQDIEVVVKPKEGEVLTESLKVKRSSSAELMCRSSFSEPLARCAYVDPQDNVHLVATPNSVKTAGHVQYFGSGIHTGECAIKISEVTADDFGQWSCQFVVYTGNVFSNFSISLSESVVGHATSIGLGVGLTVIVVLVFGVVVGTVFYRRRQLSAAHNFPSVDPLDSPISTVTTET